MAVVIDFAFHVGFTGTSRGMTSAQLAQLAAVLDALVASRGVFAAHHGDCVGADAEFHGLASARGAVVVVHPGPVDDAHHAGCVGVARLPNESHMRRNKAIVVASTVMLAAPLEEVEQALGGVWKTIALARKAKRPLAIIGPAGLITCERWADLPLVGFGAL